MMISTQNYYESEIKGKNASQIKQLIQSLTYDIHELKEKKEHPNYEFSDRIYPDECTRIAMYRDYIQKAKEELIRLNEKWDLTDEEQRVLNFNHHLDDIKMIEFHYASFSNLSFKITSEFQENQILQKRYHNEYLEHIEYLDKPTIIHELHELYLGEWDLEYSPEKYGILIEDGDQWSIDIHYDYDELLHFEGMNAYPYNFESFLECFHIEI